MRKLVGWIPRSGTLLAACRLYVDRHRPAPYENDIDMATNGEMRLLKEVAGNIRVAFDVGANVGDWTATLLSLSGADIRVHAFEPCPSARARLLERAFPSSVSVHPVGLSSTARQASMHVHGEARGTNSLYDRQGLEAGWGIESSGATEVVALETIDGFRREHRIERVDFVKIDTEGHEVDVLEGAGESLREGALRIVQFEYGGTYIDSRRLLKDVFDLTSPLDYTIFLVAPDGLVAYPRYDQRLENFQYKNFVLLHEEEIPRIASARDARLRT